MNVHFSCIGEFNLKWMYLLCAIDTSSYGHTLSDERASWWHGNKYHIFTLLFQVYDTLYVRSLLSYFPLTCDCPYGSVVQDFSINLIAFSDLGPRHLCCKNSFAKVQYLNLVSFCPHAPSLLICWWENYPTTLGRSLICYFM